MAQSEQAGLLATVEPDELQTPDACDAPAQHRRGVAAAAPVAALLLSAAAFIVVASRADWRNGAVGHTFAADTRKALVSLQSVSLPDGGMVPPPGPPVALLQPPTAPPSPPTPEEAGAAAAAAVVNIAPLAPVDPLSIEGMLDSAAASIDGIASSGAPVLLPMAPAALAQAPPATEAPTPKPEPRRIGSFMVIGDWGFDDGLHGNIVDGTRCQRAIGDRMLAKFEELGDVAFIINVGDSFYPEGVASKNDPQWESKWRSVYPEKLRSVPWYSVYGNHDHHKDPCICHADPNMCSQVNYDVHDLDRFYMPGYNWFVEHPELDLEVVGLELNKFMEGWNRSASARDLHFNDCMYTPCEAACIGNSDWRADQAFKLFNRRWEHSRAKNLVVFSHYPTDYFSSVPSFLGKLSDNSRQNITYFGGHRHNTDNKSTWQTPPNVNWLVGGGGGWSCDGKEQGFVVGEIDEHHDVKTYAELVDFMLCCPPPPPPARKKKHHSGRGKRGHG